ncbi:MAG: response regulator [Dehalococcoidia bacterium]
MASRSKKKTSPKRQDIDLGRVVIITNDPTVKDKVPVYINKRWPTAAIITTEEVGEGLELVRKTTPDLVVLDDGLPEPGGLHALGTLRSFSDVPVIILTGQGQDASEITRYMDEGANAFEKKPISSRTLSTRIKAACQKPLARAPSSAPPPEPDSPTQEEVVAPGLEAQRNGPKPEPLSLRSSVLRKCMASPSFRRRVVHHIVRKLA